MKKLITLIIVASLALTIQAQDITNTLGTGGNFLIKNSNGNTVFDFTHDLAGDPELKIGENLNPIGTDLYMLQVQTTSSFGPFISIANFHDGSGTPILRFQKARGATTQIAVGDLIGRISFQGYTSAHNFNTNSATIQSVATSTGTVIGANLKFSTSDGANHAGEVRMTIESNGRVNIATVLKLTPGSAPTTPEKGDIYMDDVASILKCWDGTVWQDLW